MKTENQRKLMKKDMKFVREGIIHLAKRNRHGYIDREGMDKELSRMATEIGNFSNKFCTVRKQKCKRKNVKPFVFVMSQPLQNFIMMALPLKADKFPYFNQGIISSHAIPTIIGLAGCSQTTAAHIQRVLPRDHATHRLTERKLNVPIFTTIIHDNRADRILSAEEKEEFLDPAMAEHKKIKEMMLKDDVRRPDLTSSLATCLA